MRRRQSISSSSSCLPIGCRTCWSKEADPGTCRYFGPPSWSLLAQNPVSTWICSALRASSLLSNKEDPGLQTALLSWGGFHAFLLHLISFSPHQQPGFSRQFCLKKRRPTTTLGLDLDWFPSFLDQPGPFWAGWWCLLYQERFRFPDRTTSALGSHWKVNRPFNKKYFNRRKETWRGQNIRILETCLLKQK